MLTSAGSAQYLHPDYIQPLPTTLDAKKSPLALLAQTCSSIGKDSPSTSSASSAKSIIPPIERKDRAASRSKTASPHSKQSPAPDRSQSTEKRDAGSTTPRCSSATSQPSSSPSGFKAPPSSSSPAAKSPSKPISDSTTTTSVTQNPTPATSSSQTNSRISINCGNMMLEVNHESSKAATGSGTHLPGTLRPDLLAPHLHSLPPHLAAAYPGLHLPLGLGHPLDPSSSAYAAALSAHSSLMKPGLPSSALSSYLNYARMKSPLAGGHCKDPYCNGHCQASASCGAGCAHCAHDKTPTSLPLGSLPLYPGALGATPSLHALSSLYAAGNPYAAMLPGAAQGLPPFVCNWVAGSDYCGKRFTTSEELFQHLRTHTSDASALAAAAALPYGGLGALPPHPSLANSGSLSPNSALRGSLGRSLSPSSLLAASRFHPYKSPLSSLPGHAGSSAASSRLPTSLPSPLAAHYPAYWAEAQRLGAAAVTP